MARAKYYPPELKKRVVDEVRLGSSIAAVARRYGVDRRSINKWMAEDEAGTLMNQNSVLPSSETKRLIDEVNRLKHLLGERELENAILRDLVRKLPNAPGQSRNSRQVDL